MQLEYDLNAGALYIRLSDAEIARTQEAGDNAAVDLDAAGGVVGIEVISAAHPWPLADILSSYSIPAEEEAEIRSYFAPPAVQAEVRNQFHVRERQPVQQEAPKISIASTAPAMVAA